MFSSVRMDTGGSKEKLNELFPELSTDQYCYFLLMKHTKLPSELDETHQKELRNTKKLEVGG